MNIFGILVFFGVKIVVFLVVLLVVIFLMILLIFVLDNVFLFVVIGLFKIGMERMICVCFFCIVLKGV